MQYLFCPLHIVNNEFISARTCKYAEQYLCETSKCSYPIRLWRRLRCFRSSRSERKFDSVPRRSTCLCVCAECAGFILAVCRLFVCSSLTISLEKLPPPPTPCIPHTAVSFTVWSVRPVTSSSVPCILFVLRILIPPFHFQPLRVYTHISHTPCIPSLLHLTSPHPSLHSKTIVILLFEGEKCPYCRP